MLIVSPYNAQVAAYIIAFSLTFPGMVTVMIHTAIYDTTGRIIVSPYNEWVL